MITPFVVGVSHGVCKVTMIDTGVECINETRSHYPINCLLTKTNGIDFGDLFIINKKNTEE
jgi:hypothetical protein